MFQLAAEVWKYFSRFFRRLFIFSIQFFFYFHSLSAYILLLCHLAAVHTHIRPLWDDKGSFELVSSSIVSLLSNHGGKTAAKNKSFCLNVHEARRQRFPPLSLPVLPLQHRSSSVTSSLDPEWSLTSVPRERIIAGGTNATARGQRSTSIRREPR